MVLPRHSLLPLEVSFGPCVQAYWLLPDGHFHRPAPPGSGWKRDTEEAQPLPDPWVLPLWYLPTGTLARATQAVKGTFPPPQSPDALLRSLQAGATWVRWRENGRPGPYFSLVQGQALLHVEGIRTVEWGPIVPDTVCRWIIATARLPMRPRLVCHHLLQTALPLAPRHALTHGAWGALLGPPESAAPCTGRRLKRISSSTDCWT